MIKHLITVTLTLKTKSLTSRKLLSDKLEEFKLPTTGLVKILKERLSNYLDTLKAEYARRNLQLDEVNVWGLQKALIVDALYVLDNKMIYASIEFKRSIVTIILEHDGVGICGKEELLLTFLADWVTVNSICVSAGNLFVAHTKGIDVISLVSLEMQCRIVEIPSEKVLSVSTIAAYKDGIIFTDPEKHRIMSWLNASNVQVFAGDSKHPGNQDGPSVSWQFYQPTGVCVKLNHVVCICDFQSGCIKVFSTLVYTAQLLSAIGKLYAAFSVHEKHQTYERRSLDEAIFLLEECLAVLRDNENMIRNSCEKAPKSLNGPEGNVAAKTIDSVALMKWGLERLRHNMTPITQQPVYSVA